MNPVLKKIEEASKENIKLLQGKYKELPEEVQKIYQSKKEYGIKDSTVNLISDVKEKIQSENGEFKKAAAKNAMIETMQKMFASFKIIPYSVLIDICSDYALYIAPINKYIKTIPNEIIPSLDLFVETCAKNKEDLNISFVFSKNYHPSFSQGHYSENILTMSKEYFFRIAAPINHFDKKSYNDIIGRDLMSLDKPKLDLSLLKLKPDMPVMKDPIIFVPFLVKDKVMAIIVDAWDKEGDDSRIRMLLKDL